LLTRQLSADPVLLPGGGGVNLTRQTKLISRGAERPRLKQSVRHYSLFCRLLIGILLFQNKFCFLGFKGTVSIDFL
jgi:hypothetical protein